MLPRPRIGTALAGVALLALAAALPAQPPPPEPPWLPNPRPLEAPPLPPTTPPPLPPGEGREAAPLPPTPEPAPPAGDAPPGILQLLAPPRFQIDYRAGWTPNQPVLGQPTDLGYYTQDLRVTLPVYKEGPDSLAVTLGARGEFVQTHAVLPNSGLPFPEELWTIRFGANGLHRFDNGWTAGLGFALGTASDEPFKSTREATASVNAFLAVPQGGHNAWLFTLAYSANSELPFPVPGVAYLWQPSDNFRMNIGLPFQVMYRPIEPLTLDFSYMLLRTVHARAAYRVTPPLRVYTGFDWTNESWFLADRAEINDRFYYYEKRVTAGVQYFVGWNTTVDLSGGYAFDRFFFQGASYSDSHHDRVDVGDGPFLALQCRVRW